jgi:hypothetical protein
MALDDATLHATWHAPAAGALSRGDASIFMRFPPVSYREKIWDHCAGSIVVEEAGGKITDATGWSAFGLLLAGFIAALLGGLAKKLIIASLGLKLGGACQMQPPWPPASALVLGLGNWANVCCGGPTGATRLARCGCGSAGKERCWAEPAGAGDRMHIALHSMVP